LLWILRLSCETLLLMAEKIYVVPKLLPGITTLKSDATRLVWLSV
jgi:hypothetical protein